jgi:hypothetical protein
MSSAVAKYSVWFIAEDGAAETVDVWADSGQLAETIARDTIEAAHPGRGWLLSHTEQEQP